ncbi:MAG TPA: YeeE/YedE thiosulfate transporter family protein [Synergistales bacterium]|nr:YeeE/YedE thiosulfate transporter family protein [Synergistales bacterium]
MDNKSRIAWNPYLAGALAGLLAVASVAIVGKFFGASTTFARLGGALEGSVLPQHVQTLAYFQKYPFKMDWQLLFLVGIAAGSFMASIWSGTFSLTLFPDMWKHRFGTSVVKRSITAFLGGILAGFGARMAGGCPSGHGLSGLMQMSVSGYISLVCFFLGGIIIARIIYGGRYEA